MLTFFKINSEQPLEWNDDEDHSTFIVVVTVVEHEFGVSTYLLCNAKNQRVVTSKFDVLGLSTIKVISQFDVRTETGVDSLNEEMVGVTGLNALQAFLEANRKRPFQYADLKRVSDAAVLSLGEQREEETESLGCPSPSFN